MPDGTGSAHPVIEIVVPGSPVGKARARSTTSRGGRAIHYTPNGTRRWEALVRGLAHDAMLRAGQRDDQGLPLPFTAPMHVTISIEQAVPAGWPAWKRRMALALELDPTVKPDSSNVAKSVEDALNGVVWHDDAQVVACITGKRYGPAAQVRVEAVPRMTYPAQISRRPNK